jgi:hypothetical protein
MISFLFHFTFQCEFSFQNQYLLTYHDENYKDKSDDEFLDDPFIKNNGGRNRNRNIIKYVKKSKLTKKYRKTKITS